MRRKYTILLALPAANALSLANFQSITSILIPLQCQLVYDSQIPSCTTQDFNTGCSAACVAGLNTIASEVISACDDVSVVGSSLLGIIQAGKIQEALCPTLASTSTSTSTTKAKTTVAQTSLATPNDQSVTIPTNSAGVTGGLGFMSSTTAASVKATTTSSQSIAIVKSTSKVSSITTTSVVSTTHSTSSPESAAGGIGGTASSTVPDKGTEATSSTKSKSTTSAQATNAATGDGDPFDASSSGDRMRGNSVWSFVIFAIGAGILLGR